MGKSTANTATTDDGRRNDSADLEAGTGNCGLCCCFPGTDVVARVVSLRCVVALALGACVFLSALFWIPPFRDFGSRNGNVNLELLAPVQASFILSKPVSFLSAHGRRLEYDIFEEIGVPNTKVSVISMHPVTPTNSTYVEFGVLSDSKYSTINPVLLSVLRSSLVELVLQESNLTLTQSIFGKPSDFEVLKFPGGITVIPLQSAPIWQITQNLFSFTLNYSIVQIQKNLDELKGQLKYGLNLRPYENVYVQMTNLNGSTVAPPVTVQASVLSDVGSRSLLPPRLKQLAQTITGSPAKNLGLNHSVFGKVKEVVLSSYLNHSIVLLGSPSPSPSPADNWPSAAPPSTINLAPSPSVPSPSTDPYRGPPCFCCNTFSPSESPRSNAPDLQSNAPTPYEWSEPPEAELSSPPAASDDTYFPPRLAPDGSPSSNPIAPSSDYSSITPAPSAGTDSHKYLYISPAPSPAVYGYSSKPKRERSEPSVSPLHTEVLIPPSPSPSSSTVKQLTLFPWLLLLLLL